MNLSKHQIEHIAKAIEHDLKHLGDAEEDALRQAAREKFFKTSDGKVIMRLRAEHQNERIGSEILSKLETAALKGFAKPFNGYVSTSDLERRVSVLSMDAQTGQDIIDRIRSEWYAKLKPAVRKRFGLKL